MRKDRPLNRPVLDFYRGIGNGNRIGIYSCRCVKQGVLWNPCGISGKGCLRWPHHALRFDISGQPDSDSALARHYVDKELVSFIVRRFLLWSVC